MNFNDLNESFNPAQDLKIEMKNNSMYQTNYRLNFNEKNRMSAQFDKDAEKNGSVLQHRLKMKFKNLKQNYT